MGAGDVSNRTEPPRDEADADLERWMKVALEEARRAAEEGEVPIGAVAVLAGETLARSHNRSVQLSDPTAHAEILALREAGRALGNYRLGGVHLYVTVEPCAMCAGALIWSRVERLVYGAPDEKAGAVVSTADLLRPGRFNHTVAVRAGVLERECREVIQDFFRARRVRAVPGGDSAGEA